MRHRPLSKGATRFVPKYVPVTTFAIVNVDTGKTDFHLSLYNVSKQECCVSPGGGAKVLQALKNRGLDKSHTTSMFHIID